MISDADFPNVFPWKAKCKPDRSREHDTRDIGHNRAPGRYEECIARWQDDGGGAWQPSQKPARRTLDAGQRDLPDLGVLVPGLVPTLVLLGASTGMLSAANTLMRNQERAHETHMAIT